MKLCKDCRWFRQLDDGKTRCDHPTSVSQPRINLVTGELIPSYHYSCTDMRFGYAFDNFCGQEGNHWEPADTTPRGFT